MLKKKIEERKIRRENIKQDEKFEKGLINTLKLLIHNKDNIIDDIYASDRDFATEEQKRVNYYKEAYPDYNYSCWAVMDSNKKVLFMITKLYIHGKKRQTRYAFDFGSEAPFVYFSPDKKTCEELYKMIQQEQTIRETKGHMIATKKEQKAIEDFLTKGRK